MVLLVLKAEDEHFLMNLGLVTNNIYFIPKYNQPTEVSKSKYLNNPTY